MADTISSKPAGAAIDLHTHSTASDGALPPTQLIEAAAIEGVGMLALTDHDTLGGIGEAYVAARAHNVRFVPGVEISVTWERRTLHIVGLAIDIESTTLKAGLEQLQQTRTRRARHMAWKLEKMGVKHASQRIAALADGGQITRTHFARLLVEDGLCRNGQQAFAQYLRPGKRLHVRADWAPLDDAIDWIHAADGLAVLAHPHGYKMTAAWRQRMYDAFAEAGGDATEVCCGNSTPDRLEASATAAETHGLMGSAGSDFHSHDQRWLRLGRLPNMPKRVTPIWQHPTFQAGVS